MTFNTSVILFEVNEIKSILGFLFVFFEDKWACDIPCTSYCPVYTKPNEFMVAVDFAHELVTMKLSFLFTELIKCKCISKKDLKNKTKKERKKKPWNMPLTAQFQWSLDYHTLSVYQEMRPSEHVAFL